jgi:hypothetical protein
MPYLMRLNRDVDDFKLGSGEEGDVTLTCPHCGETMTWFFGAPSMGSAIQGAYEHLDKAHPEPAKAPATQGATP